MDIDDSLRRQGIKILENEQNSLDGAFEKQTTEKAPEGLAVSYTHLTLPTILRV